MRLAFRRSRISREELEKQAMAELEAAVAQAKAPSDAERTWAHESSDWRVAAPPPEAVPEPQAEAMPSAAGADDLAPSVVDADIHGAPEPSATAWSRSGVENVEVDAEVATEVATEVEAEEPLAAADARPSRRSTTSSASRSAGSPASRTRSTAAKPAAPSRQSRSTSSARKPAGSRSRHA